MAGPDTHVAVGGQNKQVAEAYIAVGGQYKQVQFADLAVGGSYVSAFDPGATINEWSLTPVSGNPWQWDLALNLSNVTRAIIYGNWRNGVPLGDVIADSAGDLTWSSRRGFGTPRYVHEHWVHVFDQFGRKSVLPTLVYTPPTPPKPPKPSISSITTSSFVATGSTQVANDYYQHQIVSPFTRTGSNRQPRSITHTSLKSGTRHGVRYRYIMNDVPGPWSDTTFATTAQPSYTKGTYTLYPTGSRSYAPGFSSAAYYWRPTSEGIRAGSSKPWAPSTGRGNQRGYIFYNYNDSTHKTLRTALSRGARITGVQLYLRRRNTAHGYGGYDPRSRLQIQTHGYGSQPGGRPGIISNHNSNHGFSRGEGKWIGLPTWMGYHIVRGDSGGRGLSVGGYYSPYYLFEGVGWGSTGRVKITIA